MYSNIFRPFGRKKFEDAEQAYKDQIAINADDDRERKYIEKRIAELRDEKINLQQSNQDRESKIFNGMIKDIETNLREQGAECQKFTTVIKDNNVKLGVQAAVLLILNFCC